ncbi:MAG: hypothetical protein ACRECF_07315, partial [Methyloceanibacter sp.]
RLGGSSEADEPGPLTSAPPPAAESLPAVESPPVAESLPAASEDLDRPNRVQRAGTAVGGFARKSYRCMTSLFRKCRDETADGQALQ